VARLVLTFPLAFHLMQKQNNLARSEPLSASLSRMALNQTQMYVVA
jgi:hypothetical protein